jgi:glycerol kinase
MSVLVVDVGTSGVRAAVVGADARPARVFHREVLPRSPAPNFVEFDAGEMARAVIELAEQAVSSAGHEPVTGVGVANQRTSTILWERDTGVPVGPGIGWQDLRTVGTCLMLKAQGIPAAPNESLTKLMMLLDLADPERKRDLCFGTVDTWVIWTLSGGGTHVTDLSNAALTGLLHPDADRWDSAKLATLNIPESVLPALVDSTGVVGEASILPGAPPICGIAGDQQASLIGQGCIRPGDAKATFGTGGMLDLCTGRRPAFERKGDAGTFPIIGWSAAGHLTWGVESVMLSAGTCVEWLRDDLGLIPTAAASDTLASSVPDADGVYFVPALLGLGTPVWDFGARGTLLGLTRGSTRAHVVRAVLEGIAQRGADLLDAAEADSGRTVTELRVDGGMSRNGTFVQSLADALERPVHVSAVSEATTLGAAFLAGVAVGQWADLEEATAAAEPPLTVEPARKTNRARWLDARDRARRQLPDLSTIEF